MSESSDDILTRPLGVAAPEPARRPSRLPSGRTAGLAAGAGLALLAGMALTLGDPRGGEPRAGAAIVLREPPAPQAAAADPGPAAVPPPVQAAAPAAGRQHTSASEIERASGVIVTRPAGSVATEQAVIVRVPAPDGVRLAPAPDPRLVERGRHGAMPRIGEGRLRALDLYARPDDGAGAARIALVLSGVGTGQAATAAAIARLPPPISLALSPYAADLERTAARAREAGHEILVQLPLEPFDYPDSDPGPQTLLAASRPSENLDRLAWVLSRVPGAVGVVNLMGGKVLAEPAALEPVLKEVGARGLGFLDEGGTQGSQVMALAGRAGAPAARAEIVLDAVARPEAIERELARAEAQARRGGLALVSASARQMSIDVIARWARDLEARGVRLVPVSAALRAAEGAARRSAGGNGAGGNGAGSNDAGRPEDRPAFRQVTNAEPDARSGSGPGAASH